MADLDLSLDELIAKRKEAAAAEKKTKTPKATTVKAGKEKKEASGRPAPYDKKSCLACGSTAHRKDDCPHKAKECKVCQKIGHIASVCRSNQKAAASGAQANPGSAPKPPAAKPPAVKACLACGSTAHVKAECPHKEKECKKCGKVGHIAVTCRSA